MNLTNAFYVRLATDSTLIDLLGTYQSAPAVFTFDPIPEDALLPLIVTSGNNSDVNDDTKTGQLRDVDRDIRIYAEAEGSVVLVETIAERVRQLFHRHELAVDDWQTVTCEASGPTRAPTDESIYGRTVTVRLLVAASAA